MQFNNKNWPETVEIVSATELQELRREMPRWQSQNSTPPNGEVMSYQLEIVWANQTVQTLYLTHDLRLFSASLTTEYLPPPRTSQLIGGLVQELKNGRFGQLLPWSEASRLLPRYGICTLVDLETGISWRAQRRAGSRHADIQPLTKADTARLKAAYGGSWSWDRRAVVVLVEDKQIAASINGMPHGAGALDNGFPGHHCLHFAGSTTHSKTRPDPAHQIMVHKAAGNLHQYLASLKPDELQVAMLAMAGQGDAAIVKLGILNPADDSDPSRLVRSISNIKIWHSQLGEVQAGSLTGTYNLSIYFRNDPREYRRTITITSRYVGHLGRWLVEPDFLEQLVCR